MRIAMLQVPKNGPAKLIVALTLGLFSALTAMAVICYVPKESACPQTVGNCWLIDDLDTKNDPSQATKGSLTITSDPILFDCAYACPGQTDPVLYYPTVHFTGICPPG